MAQLERADPPGIRLSIAIGLGLVSIAGSVVLVAADGFGGGVRWSHHAGVSAAPLLLVAGAVVAVTVAHPVKGRRALMRLVAVIAFTAWGLAQLLPESGAAGALNDLAILLFTVEAGGVVIWDARALRPSTGQSRSWWESGRRERRGPGRRRSSTKTTSPSTGPADKKTARRQLGSRSMLPPGPGG